MKKRELVILVAFAALTVAIALLPSMPGVANDSKNLSLRSRVVAVDASAVETLGLVDYGSEMLTVEMLEGERRGEQFKVNNELRAQPDLDKRFKVGETAIVSWPKMGPKEGEILLVRDHWRMGWALGVFGLFALLLVVFGGFTGLKALFSFVFSCVVIWKLLVPMCLSGYNALWTSFATVSILTAVIMYLVAGLTRKGVSAFFGAMLGILSSLVLSSLITSLMHVTGNAMPYALSLRYSGYEELNLFALFSGTVILASSGAVMDLAMDIAAGVSEIKRHNEGISKKELLLSGLRIGRSVVGTMTTTLLLAYSGGYLTLIMLFAAQGTRPMDFLNSTLVAPELVKTLVGSIGLVLVAPFTALVSAFVIGKSRQ